MGKAGDKRVRSSSVFLRLHHRPHAPARPSQSSGSCVGRPLSLHRLRLPAGCVVAGLFVLADVSARTQLQQAVVASCAPQGKPAPALLCTKLPPLDRQRLSATIAMISHADAE